MPFAKRSTYTLTLAISAALISSYASAEAAPSEPEMAWSCSMTKDGEWDCAVNEALVKEVEQQALENSSPAEPNQSTNDNTTVVNSAPQKANGSNDSKEIESVAIESAPAAIAAPVNVIRSTTTPADQPTPNRARNTRLATKTSTNGVWDCIAGANGDWVCNGEGTATQNIATQPIIDTNRPVANNTVTSSQPFVTQEIIGSEWQCGTTASGDWDCHKVNIHALSVPTGNGRQGQSAPAYITENPYSHLDWAYYRDPKGQQCSGRYLEPQFASTGDEHLANPPLYLEADQSSTILGGLSRLQGGVTMRQGKRRLSSSSAELDQVTNKARLEGNVTFREPGLLMLSDSAQVDTTTSEAIFSNAQYVIHEEGLRGKADRIIRLEDERLRIEDGDYTYCPPYSEAWNLEADSIVLNKEEGYGEAEDAVLRVAGIPIFYAPYFTFPIDDTRRSGFLYPSLGYSNDGGIDLSVPYYFNIAPNIDDTLTTRLITDRGLLLENELRYLNNWSENTLSTAYIAEDDTTNDARWLLGINHEGRFANNWHTNIDYTSVSDEDYFDDLNTNLEITRQDHLDKRADITYLEENWAFRARVHDYQTISTSSTAPYKRLPELTLSGNDSFGEGGEFKYKAQYTQFDRNLTGLTGSDRVIGDRRFFLPSASYMWQNSWGYIKPELALWSSSYSLENQVTGFSSSPSINAPILSIDSGLVLERELSNGGTHTLEPRLFGLYVPEENQDAIPDFDTSALDFSYYSLFRKNRFSGHDRLGDTQQVSLGLSSNIYSDQGQQIAGFSIGQAYYFADRKIQLNSTDPDETSGQSDIATEAVWYLSPNFRASLDAILDNSDFKNTESNLRLRYNSDKDHRFDFSYRYEDNVRKQTDLSFIWPVANHWTAMGRWLYDIKDSDSLETALGLEYESCCWKVSFAGRRWLDDTDKFDTGVFLNFTLKGLGSFGSGSSGFMNDIIGYEEREEQNEY